MKKSITLQTISQKAMLSRNEAAFYLGVNVNTLDRAKIPHAKIGSRCIFSKQVLDAWIAEHSKGSEENEAI